MTVWECMGTSFTRRPIEPIAVEQCSRCVKERNLVSDHVEYCTQRQSRYSSVDHVTCAYLPNLSTLDFLVQT